MKRKIAIFVNGWSNEYLELVLEGIRRRAGKERVDLFVFVNFSSGPETKLDNLGEKSIFTLPDLKRFDGVILAANTFNLVSERAYLTEMILRTGVPAVSLEYELTGIPYLGTDNYKGIYALTEHVIQEHKARDFLFVSGPRDNSESQIRLQAMKDALQAAGLELPESRIIEADWSYYAAYEKIIKWLHANREIPDAIICANDEMAIGVCTALEAMGIEVPGQTIVTGCDNTTKGQELYPILTTVARSWDRLGYEGMNLLLKHMAGEQVPMKTVFDSESVIGESCGCSADQARVAHRLGAIREIFRKQRENNMNEWHLRYIDEMLAKMRSVGDLKNNMKWNFEYDHSFEGSNFLICLVDDYFADDETRVITQGRYTRNMEIYINLLAGRALPNKVFPTRQLLPDYVAEGEESHTYLFAPLHTEDICIGYVVQVDNLQRLYEQTLYTWIRHISQDLERVRQNVRLEELNRRLREVSVTDGLTGLKNRTGCDTLAIPYLQKCQREGKTSAIVFADVNRMKLINDKYGHLQGDLALCTVAEAIKKTLPKDWIAVRYGGDEFIMVGACQDMDEAESIKQRLAAALEELKMRKKLVFPLTASFGAVIMHPEENYNLEEYLRKADKAMYDTKQKYHANDAK